MNKTLKILIFVIVIGIAGYFFFDSILGVLSGLSALFLGIPKKPEQEFLENQEAELKGKIKDLDNKKLDIGNKTPQEEVDYWKNQ